MKRNGAEQFWAKVEMTDECWTWTHGKDRDGYGICRFYGMGERRAHRVAFTLTYGKIPAKKEALHKCDNPLCVRPSHLFLGTKADNVKDKVKKKRQAFGERHGRSKLTSEDVAQIRSAYTDGGYTHRSLGVLYKVSHHSIGRIIREEGWNNLK